MIVVIDTGMGNVGSVSNMIRYLGHNCIVSRDPDILTGATKLILPGVGSFDQGISSLQANGLEEALRQRVLNDEVPILGICLGMQMMTRGSEEGSKAGLGWFDAYTMKFQRRPEFGDSFRIPHMGWNIVTPNKRHSMFNAVEGVSRFYFVHSFYVSTDVDEDVMATTCYGAPFVSALQKNNIYGVQFHPEKSHIFGMSFLKNFIRL